METLAYNTQNTVRFTNHNRVTVIEIFKHANYLPSKKTKRILTYKSCINNKIEATRKAGTV